MSKNKLNSTVLSTSPVLPNNIKNYLIDIDGTITEDVPNEDSKRMVTVSPFSEAIEVINQWHNEGHIITLFTSRTEEVREITENWLDTWGFKYHNLLMGKPRGGNYVIIDNHEFKSCHYNNNWESIKKEMDNYTHNYEK